MTITGEMLIGSSSVRGKAGNFSAINPATDEKILPSFGSGDVADVTHACNLAWEAFGAFAATSLQERAAFLEEIARNIVALGDDLIVRASAETGLPRARLEGERARTTGQLQLFADVIREGSWLDVRIDSSIPDRKPFPRPALRSRNVPLGPVAVFGASNFPLAFSVAGGDTASALAAGCPVVVKAHPAHPGTSELAGRAIQKAVKSCGLPEGVFSLLFGSGNEIGAALVADRNIKAVGFTGSRRGGLALADIAAKREEPIPVYSEMSSINPVFLLPAALSASAESLGTAFVGSLTMGVGQFCTNPGLIIAIEGADLTRFVESANSTLNGVAAGTMLTPGIHGAYDARVAKLGANKKVASVAKGVAPCGPNQGQAVLFKTDAKRFLGDPELQDEVFGASSLVITCSDLSEMISVAQVLEGQLTATVHADETDAVAAKALMPTLERKAGRIVFNGWPTGVEVCHAMVHGGPFPATSDSRATSVGALAIRRFLRPVCYQNVPVSLLAEELHDDNPLKLWRRINGTLGKF